MKTLLNKLKSIALATLLGISIASPSVVQVASQAVAISASAVAVTALTTADVQATSMTDYLENKLLDWLIRGQTLTQLTNVYISLHTASCSDSSTGTEVTGGSYARVTVAANMTQWAGTQSAGSTTASSGTNGTTSNNNAVTFPAPTANWGTITHFGVFDASTSGNQLFCAALTVSKTVNNGDAAPSFAAGALTIQLDN
jgi:hypothetical protein